MKSNFVALMKFSNGVKIARWSLTQSGAQFEIDRYRAQPLHYGDDRADLVDARIGDGEAALPFVERSYGDVFARHAFA